MNVEYLIYAGPTKKCRDNARWCKENGIKDVLFSVTREDIAGISMSEVRKMARRLQDARR